MVHRRELPGRAGLAILAACIAAGLLGAGAGCGKKMKKTQKPAVVQTGPDFTGEWGTIRADGMEGKFLVNQGLGHFQSANTPEERSKGCEEMVDGYRKVLAASDKADKLLDAARQQSPGKDFSGWEEEISGWMESLDSVRKSLPREYSDRLH
jgi:hypothetical protein